MHARLVGRLADRIVTSLSVIHTDWVDQPKATHHEQPATMEDYLDSLLDYESYESTSGDVVRN